MTVKLKVTELSENIQKYILKRRTRVMFCAWRTLSHRQSAARTRETLKVMFFGFEIGFIEQKLMSDVELLGFDQFLTFQTILRSRFSRTIYFEPLEHLTKNII